MPPRERETLSWRKSSYSNADNGACVEVAYPANGVAIRDSKNRASGLLTVPTSAWSTFLDTLRRPGE